MYVGWVGFGIGWGKMRLVQGGQVRGVGWLEWLGLEYGLDEFGLGVEWVL